MRKISPLKQRTRLDRIQPHDLYYAVDIQGERPRYLHLSGQFLTNDKNYLWYGTIRQFRRICALYDWDALTLIGSIK